MKEYLKKKGEIIAVIIITIGLSVQLVFIFIPPFNDWSFELDSELLIIMVVLLEVLVVLCLLWLERF